MARMRGSKSMDMSPKGSVWSKRCRKKLRVAKEPPFKLYNAKQGEGSWVTKEILDANDAVIIKGHFNTEEGYKATAVILSDSFFRMQYNPEYKPIFRNLGLEEYFSLQPWGVDIQRSWELLTTLDDDGSALVTDLDDNKVKVTITEQLLEEALKLKKGEKELEQIHPAKEKEEVFNTPKGQVNTFQYMVYQDVVAPLRIYMQHFKLLKPERHTIPELRLAFPFTKARFANAGLSYNFIKHILNDIRQHVKGPNFQKNCHLAAGHMLTRIAYHALGILDELPPVFTASASSSRSVEAFPPKPARQLRGKGKDILYEESEDEDEDENDEENEDEEDQEGDDEGKSKSEGEKESPANLRCLIPFEDPSLDEIYRNEERMWLERACDIASKKRKRNQEDQKKPEPPWKERRTKQKEDPHFAQKFDTDMEGMAPHIAALLREHLLRQHLRGKGKEENELRTATRSTQSNEQEGEQAITKEQDEKLNPQGDVAGRREELKEGSSTLGKGPADIDPRRDEDRKDTVELLDVTSHKSPQSEVTLGLTSQGGRVAYVESLLETKSDPGESFDPTEGPQKTQETKEQVEEAKEVCKESVSEEAKEEGATEEKGEGKAKNEEVKALSSKADGWEERKEKEESEEKNVVSILQMGFEGLLVPWENGGKAIKNGVCSESPCVQTDERALDKGRWLEQRTSQVSGLATHSISQLSPQGIPGSVFASPFDTLQTITINMNDSDEMLDGIVGLLQRYKTQTTAFKNYSARLAAQTQLIRQLHAEKEDLTAKHTLVVEKLSMAEAHLSELQGKYRQQEAQRKLEKLNFDKLAKVHFATLQRLDNANKVLDQLAQFPLGFVKNEAVEESTVDRSLKEQSIELTNQLATERLMRNTLATAFKGKESELRHKIESLEKELFMEKLKQQSEPVCTEKSKAEQGKNFPIDLNMLDSGEASSSHIEHQPIYISSEGSQKEEM